MRHHRNEFPGGAAGAGGGKGMGVALFPESRERASLVALVPQGGQFPLFPSFLSFLFFLSFYGGAGVDPMLNVG